MVIFHSYVSLLEGIYIYYIIQSHDIPFEVDVEPDWPLLPRDPTAIPVVVVWLGAMGSHGET